MRLAVCLATHTARGIVGIVVLLRKGVMVEKKDLRRWKFLFPFLLWEGKRVRCSIVKTRIIEKDARTSRISPFGLRGENTAKRFSFSPLLRQIKENQTDLTRRGNSNVLARFSILPAPTVFKRNLRFGQMAYC